MKKIILLIGVIVILFCTFFMISATENENTHSEEKNFYENSLHYTNKGLEFWYSKEQGGLERLTGIPFSELDCTRCHVKTCDKCHKKEVGGKPAYSVEKARAQEICQECHGMETLEDAKKYKTGDKLDVHFKKGMLCMDCHSARDIHGDGTAFNSLQDLGALETTCEKCHSPLSESESHSVHNGKLDCNTCHVRDLLSCYNCHFDTRVEENKSVSLPLKNMLFLVNRGEKVTLANFHTFVYQNKAMIVFAPAFPHYVMKEGRKCGECHDTQIIRDMEKNNFTLVVYREGRLENVKGVIPVLEGIEWNFPYLNYIEEKWVPIETAVKPLLNYGGYCTPLSREQFAKLAKSPEAEWN